MYLDIKKCYSLGLSWSTGWNSKFLNLQNIEGIRFQLKVKVFVVFYLWISVRFNILPGQEDFWNRVYKWTYDGKNIQKLIIYTAPDCTSSAFAYDDYTVYRSFEQLLSWLYNFSQFQCLCWYSILVFICLDFLTLA